MIETVLLGEDSHTRCLLCQSEIPRAELLTVEAKEYAYYFCGQGCYQQWEWEQDVEIVLRRQRQSLLPAQIRHWPGSLPAQP